jgi:hypothetical protein
MIRNFNPQDAHAQATQKVLAYLKQDLPKMLPQDTIDNIQQQGIKKIGTEAKKRREEIQKNHARAYEELSTIKSINRDTVSSIGTYREIIKYKASLLKGYAFIMKTREKFTNTTVSYVVMAESFSNVPALAKLSLEQLIPHVSISASRDRELKLQLFQTEEIIKTLREASKQSDNQTKRGYINIKRHYRKMRYQGGYQGFQLERAIKTAARRGVVQAYATDIDAFYTGGDLRQSLNEVPIELLNQQSTTQENLEVKNLASKFGAQLAMDSTIEDALMVIEYYCLNQNLQKADITKALNDNLFTKNITPKLRETVHQALAKKVDSALAFIKN